MSGWKTPKSWVHCDGLNLNNSDIAYSYHPAGWHAPENCILTRGKKMSKKDDRIRELEEQVASLSYDVLAFENELQALEDDYLKAVSYNRQNRAPEIPFSNHENLLSKIKNHEPRYAGDVALDFWPLRDWFRLSFKRFRPGQYAQLVVGPVRIEWYAA